MIAIAHLTENNLLRIEADDFTCVGAERGCSELSADGKTRESLGDRKGFSSSCDVVKTTPSNKTIPVKWEGCTLMFSPMKRGLLLMERVKGLGLTVTRELLFLTLYGSRVLQ